MKRSTKFTIAGLGVSLVLALFLSPLASSLPDGLEKVIEKLVPGGQTAESKPTPFSPLPDYGLPGVDGEWLSTGIAGVIGTVLVFAALFFLGKALARRGSSARPGREGD